MRIVYPDIESVKSIAKRLAHETGAKLSDCQEALAKVSGYDDWHELHQGRGYHGLSIGALTIDQLAALIARLAARLRANGGDVQYALCTSPAVPRVKLGIAEHVQLRASVFRQMEIPNLGRRKPGTVGTLKGTGKQLILRQFGRPVSCITNRSANAAVADFEFVTPRIPLPLFIPTRLYLAYGIWTEADGAKVLFSRDYMPLWRLREGLRPERLSPIEWINYTSQSWFWTDANAPWDHRGRTAEHVQRLEDFGVRAVPRLVEVLPTLVSSDRVSSLRLATQSYFKASEFESDNLLTTLTA